jgi:general secretion pathway protein J
MKSKRPIAGFTLLELLVSIAVFAIISIVVFSGLDSTMKAKAQTELHSERLIQIQKAFSIMQRDFEHAVARPIRDQYGDPDTLDAMQNEEGGVSFTRGGRPNPLGSPVSELERVSYTLQDDRLMRIRWLALDQPIDPKMVEQPLLEQVEDLRFRFMTDAQEWIEYWPPPEADNDILPRAVEVVLETADMGEITRMFLIPF